MPEMFQVFTTFFWLVSTIEIVLSPVSAATSAAGAAAAVTRRAAEAASMDLRVIGELPGSLSPNCDDRRATQGVRGADADRRVKKL